MTPNLSFLRRFGRHLRILFPLGLAVGALVGLAFGDVPFGLVAGAGLGLLLSVVFALHTA